jgi:hypothetical protein
MRLLDVPVDDIDIQDERFRFSYHFDLEKLLISIKKIGLINPPIVVKRDGSPYIVVSGWKRILACIRLCMTHIPIYLIDEKDDSRAFILSLYENWAVRSFNILEKAEIVSKLKDFDKDEKKIVREFFPLLDIPANLSYLDLYLKIARLDPTWKKIVYDKKIPLSALQFLIEFKPEDRKALLPLIMPMNVNKLKQFCENLYELWKNTGDSPKVLLSDPAIQSVCQSEKLSPLQKADDVRSLVRSKRYPTLSSWTKSFDTSLKKARLTKDVTFEPSSFFEDGEFSITFSLFDIEAFHQRIAKLRELGADEALFSLFKNYPDG